VPVLPSLEIRMIRGFYVLLERYEVTTYIHQEYGNIQRN
jgi:hypothetical protein